MTWSLLPTTSKNKLQKTDRRLMLPVGFFALPRICFRCYCYCSENELTSNKKVSRKKPYFHHISMMKPIMMTPNPTAMFQLPSPNRLIPAVCARI